jgi:hypothetical protein
MAKNPLIKRAFATSEYTPNSVMEVKRCIEDPIYFMKKYVKIMHPLHGAVPFELYDYQEEMVRAIHENKDTILLCSRQMGKTTVAAMYLLWMAMFQDDKRCIIASKGMSHAVEIQSRVKFAYEELPHWLKPGCKYYNRTAIEFDNESKIICEATSENTGRGSSPSVIFLDEIAFIPRSIQDAMWSSLTPALAMGGKFILTSTPNGDSDLFARLWFGAKAEQNTFKPLEFLWWRHPDRDKSWYDDMASKLGPIKAKQELDCEFLSSDALLVNSMRLAQLRYEAPLYESLGFKFWVPEESLGGRNKIYMVSMDPATGSGRDFTAIEVFDFPGINQICEYRTNDVKIPLIYAKLTWLLKLLTRPTLTGRAEVLWTFERNGIGEAISVLYYNDENQIEMAELVSDHPAKFGVFTSGRQKILAALQLKSLIEKADDKGMKIKSEALIHELKHFVSKGNSYEGKAGCTDDSVMATLGIMRLLKRLSEYNEEAFKQVNEYVNPDASMDENDDPVPFAML